MIGFMILKILTTAVMAFFAIASAFDAPKQKKHQTELFYLRSQCSLHLE